MPGHRITRALGAGLTTLLAATALVATALAPAPAAAAPAADTCALKPKPAGKVLQGYWENWDGAANGVHPPFGWAPSTTRASPPTATTSSTPPSP